MTKLQSEDIQNLSQQFDDSFQEQEPAVIPKSVKKTYKPKKKIKPLRVLSTILIILLCICIAAVGSFFTLRYIGKNSMLRQSGTISVPTIDGQEISSSNNGYDVVYNGEKYTYNKNISTILFMGVDRRTFGTNEGVVGTGGQADVLMLAAIDMQTGKTTTFAISRETMTDINIYSENGTYIGTQNAQICLSYAYGDGKQTSCENVMRAVQRMFYGVNINSYLALDLDGINSINNAMGGVSVVMPMDFAIDSTQYSQGDKVHLTGTMAERFVRSRSHTEIDANNARMARQKVYLDSFIAQSIARTKNDITTPLKIYDMASDYIYTDMDAPKVSFIATELLSKRITSPNITSVPGNVVDGGDYAEFIVDQKAFYEMFLNAYYTKVK